MLSVVEPEKNNFLIKYARNRAFAIRKKRDYIIKSGAGCFRGLLRPLPAQGKRAPEPKVGGEASRAVRFTPA